MTWVTAKAAVRDRNGLTRPIAIMGIISRIKAVWSGASKKPAARHEPGIIQEKPRNVCISPEMAVKNEM
jgi:hypothetical protein